MGAVWLQPQVLLWYEDQRFWFLVWRSLRVGPRDNCPHLCLQHSPGRGVLDGVLITRGRQRGGLRDVEGQLLPSPPEIRV